MQENYQQIIQANFQELEDMSFRVKGITECPRECIKIDILSDSA